jgi:hypothetical protein
MHERVGLRGRPILTSGTAWIFSALAHKKEILIVTGSAWSSQSLTHKTKTPTFYPVCEGMAVYSCFEAGNNVSTLPPMTAHPRYALQVIVHRA